MNQDEDVQQIVNKITQIENKIDKLETKLNKILELLEKDCKKMTDHIDFIENVYDNVKSPFYYLMDKVNSLSLLSNTRMIE
jgi:uncharacterized protein Yka (UPF0111/DUF47 family)